MIFLMQWIQQILSEQPDWFISLKYGLFVLGFCLLALGARELIFWFLKLNRLRDKLEIIEAQNKEILNLLDKPLHSESVSTPVKTEEIKKDRFSLEENQSYSPEQNN